MLGTIQFDDKAVSRGREIDDIASDWHLATKGNPLKPMSPQCVPELSLRLGHVPAK